MTQESDSGPVLLKDHPALRDYAEYRRMGGRFDFATWWERYRADYPDTAP